MTVVQRELDFLNSGTVFRGTGSSAADKQGSGAGNLSLRSHLIASDADNARYPLRSRTLHDPAVNYSHRVVWRQHHMTEGWRKRCLGMTPSRRGQ